ncbi:Acyl-CoA dehydrogenase family protein [Sulfidibacter corallicola]|uniref:Acyl-CoA dehydrogenase family protein n=1 Tax=Sulfidibacter corallicola TaxID=2818388 RepID=A0A8A4TM52_SULCO|nr:acyl-CoA dehydrogenase family protein [Sulfidibacter corallicola]QTD51069.1 acyl-CoA dehydrogenase family protein [Sulfidibacter corallicola]
MTVAEKEKKKSLIVGGSFLTEAHPLAEIFTPEDLTEDDHDLADTVADFVEGEVVPNIKKLEEGRNEDMVAMLKKAGELGFLAAEVPEAYGGMDLKKTTATFVGEKLIKHAGFMVSLGAHTGIGTMPITYFGNEEQRTKYLPRLASGEILAAYALTETSSGSDAMNARTKAVLSEDGQHYVLNGNKMWITNAGFADLFIVFAKINGEQFSAFIVESAWEGVSVAAEEKKMGIKASSTRMLNLDDVKVPVGNLLGQPGDGAKIAFNILNIGRFKLGGAAVGGCKQALECSTKYAIDRKAFEKSITEFGVIKHKLGEMAIRTFATESMVYRSAGYISAALEDIDFNEQGAAERILKSIREYAIECAMAKVAGSEALDYVADEAVQIHGGYGYSAEYEVERIYRDSRINRIFEGTNEINRLLTVDMLIKKAMKGELPLMEKVQALMGELMGMPSFDFDQDMSLLADEKKVVENAKKIGMFIAGAGFQKFMEKIEHEQELLAMAADIFTETYVMESALQRTLKKAEKDGEEAAELMIKMTKAFIHDSIERIGPIAKTALAAIEEGDALMTMNAALRRLLKHQPVNTVAIRRDVAAAVINKGGYPL